jgi:hypothetical protein
MSSRARARHIRLLLQGTKSIEGGVYRAHHLHCGLPSGHFSGCAFDSSASVCLCLLSLVVLVLVLLCSGALAVCASSSPPCL